MQYPGEGKDDAFTFLSLKDIRGFPAWYTERFECGQPGKLSAEDRSRLGDYILSNNKVWKGVRLFCRVQKGNFF